MSFGRQKPKRLTQRPSADGRFRRHITFACYTKPWRSKALLREKFLGEKAGLDEYMRQRDRAF